MVARTRGSCHSVRPVETDANASRHTSLERGHLFAVHDVGGFTNWREFGWADLR
jgi:hypothetical protein